MDFTLRCLPTIWSKRVVWPTESPAILDNPCARRHKFSVSPPRLIMNETPPRNRHHVKKRYSRVGTVIAFVLAGWALYCLAPFAYWLLAYFVSIGSG